MTILRADDARRLLKRRLVPGTVAAALASAACDGVHLTALCENPAVELVPRVEEPRRRHHAADPRAFGDEDGVEPSRLRMGSGHGVDGHLLRGGKFGKRDVAVAAAHGPAETGRRAAGRGAEGLEVARESEDGAGGVHHADQVIVRVRNDDVAARRMHRHASRPVERGPTCCPIRKPRFRRGRGQSGLVRGRAGAATAGEALHNGRVSPEAGEPNLADAVVARVGDVEHERFRLAPLVKGLVSQGQPARRREPR
mmetsp:Transcript_26486/g.89120  ORF Transcript_26486/g.89120 Transcript_26486/m.89120 type:complete len:254 (+) Transcript_26486:978-1739(+)